VRSFRNGLTYANLMSTAAVFIALSGATAFAATQLAKNSVGSKQLKKNAVTAAKIGAGAVTGEKIAAGAVGGTQLAGGAVLGSKLADGAATGSKIGDSAVTGGKIADGAVTASKVADGSIGAAKLDPALSIAQVVTRVIGTQSVPFPVSGTAAPYSFDNPTFTQPAGEDDLFLGTITTRFSSACKSPRSIEALLRIDSPGSPGNVETLAHAVATDESGTGEVTRTAQFGAVNGAAMAFLAPSSPTPHTLSISLVRAFCGTGSPVNAGATATGAQVDVIGVR
jgi:hypothetical protein